MPIVAADMKASASFLWICLVFKLKRFPRHQHSATSGSWLLQHYYSRAGNECSRGKHTICMTASGRPLNQAYRT